MKKKENNNMKSLYIFYDTEDSRDPVNYVVRAKTTKKAKSKLVQYLIDNEDYGQEDAEDYVKRHLIQDYYDDIIQ